MIHDGDQLPAGPQVIINRRAVRAILAVTVSAIVLSSCAVSAPRGRSVDQASEVAATLPGIGDASVELRNYRSGFTSEWGSTVYFKPSPGFEEADKSALFRDLLRVGWSVNEHKLNNGVALSVGRGSDLDLTSLAREADLPPFASNPRLPFQIIFSTAEMQEMFGPWPGE